MNYRLIALCVIVMCCLGCGGNSPLPSNNGVLQFTSLVGGEEAGVQVTRSGDSLNFRCENLAPTGCFIHIPLGEDKYLAGQSWPEYESLLHLAITSKDGIDIGVIALPGCKAGPVVATLQLTADPTRSTSIPPYLSDNQILQKVFEVSALDENRVLLEWPQVNVGDYDLNGEVSIADLVPLAIHFNQTYDPESVDAPSLPIFWIDGDLNGEVGLSDITPIAAHYNSTVAGYKVEQNGESLELGSPDNPAVVRDRTSRSDESLPPLYSVVVDGQPEDKWDVIPVDPDGQPGTSLQDVVEKVSTVRAEVLVNGAGLLPLNASIPGQPDDGNSLLRIIEEGEILDGVKYGGGFNDGNGANFFYDIPRDQLVYLEVAYYPAVDPVTGIARTSGPDGPGAPVPQSALTRTAIPFILAERTSLQRITVEIGFKPNPAGGYYINVQTKYDPPQPFLERFLHPELPADELSSARARTARLDAKAGLISWDQGLQGSYDHAPALFDTNRNGISAALSKQLGDYLAYTASGIEPGSLTGRIESLDEGSGTLVLNTPIAVTQYNEYTIANRPAYFSEATQFIERITTGTGFYDRRFDPSLLTAGDLVVVEVDFMGGVAPLWDQIWARRLTRIVPNQVTATR